jgi:hypothetical protein
MHAEISLSRCTVREKYGKKKENHGRVPKGKERRGRNHSTKMDNLFVVDRGVFSPNATANVNLTSYLNNIYQHTPPSFII